MIAPPASFPALISALVKACTDANPNVRPTMERVVDGLRRKDVAVFDVGDVTVVSAHSDPTVVVPMAGTAHSDAQASFSPSIRV